MQRPRGTLRRILLGHREGLDRLRMFAHGRDHVAVAAHPLPVSFRSQTGRHVGTRSSKNCIPTWLTGWAHRHWTAMWSSCMVLQAVVLSWYSKLLIHSLFQAWWCIHRRLSWPTPAGSTLRRMSSDTPLSQFPQHKLPAGEQPVDGCEDRRK